MLGQEDARWDGEIFQRQQMKPLASRRGCEDSVDVFGDNFKMPKGGKRAFIKLSDKILAKKTEAAASTLAAFSGPISQVAKLGN